jgi:hypothetical protein
MMNISRFAIIEWPDMFKPTKDNLQNMCKWFALKGERTDIIIAMNENQRAILKQEIAPEYLTGKEYLSGAIRGANPYLGLLINVVDIYLYLGYRIIIAQKEINDEHIREDKDTGGESTGA